MDRKRLFKILAYLILIIFVLNFLASKFYWYLSIWWSDMSMHFLGGLWLALVFIWFSSESFRLSREPKALTLFIVKTIFWVLFVGILWEVFEFYFINHVAQNSFNVLDTISDIFFDLAGGTFAVLYFLKKTMPTNENKL